MLRQSIRQSEKVNSWPIPLRYFWTQLWGYCDDHGRGRNDPRLIVADTFPIDDEVTGETVGRWMKALEGAGVIRSYEVEGKAYFECVNWAEHQELKYLKKTDIPDSSGSIPKAGKYSEKVQNVSELSARREGEEKRRKGEVEEPTPTPSRTCPKHPEGTDKPCRACKEARERYEAAQVKGTPMPKADATCEHGRPIGVECIICTAERAVA